MHSTQRSLNASVRFVLSRTLVGFVASGIVLLGLVAAALGAVAGVGRGSGSWLSQAHRGASTALAPFIGAWRACARQERATVARFSGQPLGESYRTVPLAGRGQVLVADPATWLDAAYFAAMALVGVLVAAPLLGVAVATIVALEAILAVGVAAGVTQVTVALIAIAAVWAVLALARTEASLQVVIAQTLLGPREGVRMAAEVQEERIRSRLTVEAAEAERRRIERDLHDGAQQRLTALAMDLGMAREKMASDPAAAAAMVERAHAEAKLAIRELRDLARGIHPALLTDRGLDVAVRALAARSPVAVEVQVDLPRRPSAAVESAAYFVVAEALTNVARHAAAEGAVVRVGLHDRIVAVEVCDDGRGGADPAAGTGLAGLADRIAGLGGRLGVSSPPGGPTVVDAEIPCAS